MAKGISTIPYDYVVYKILSEHPYCEGNVNKLLLGIPYSRKFSHGANFCGFRGWISNSGNKNHKNFSMGGENDGKGSMILARIILILSLGWCNKSER